MRSTIARVEESETRGAELECIRQRRGFNVATLGRCYGYMKTYNSASMSSTKDGGGSSLDQTRTTCINKHSTSLYIHTTLPNTPFPTLTHREKK